MNKEEIIQKIEDATYTSEITEKEKLASTLLNVYIALQKEANKSITIAVYTDSSRAILRNRLCEYANIDPQDLQESVEEIARSY